MLPFKPGDIIQSVAWKEPLKIDIIEPVEEAYIHIVGALIESNERFDRILSFEDLSQVRLFTAEAPFSAPPRDVFLALETRRYRHAARYDPLLAMNISKVDPLPHQIEAVYGYILHQPRVRFLIADDPGAGKTIMAGLVIKEMKLRGLARRILIVAPGHLKDQWQRELKDRFEERFTLVDRQTMRNNFGANVWENEFQVISSLDFARQEDVMLALTGVHWDLVIVDEAHKMAAYRYGNKLEKTKRYRLGELLSRNSAHLLFLTATPHRGDPENFRLFLDLLQPGAFATTEMLDASIRNGDNPLFIRRLKEDLRDFAGHPLFLPRRVRTVTFDLGQESPAEKKLYEDLSRYVNEQYNRALASDKRRNIAFALVILQRRLASSTYALYRSLERRKQRLEEMRTQADAFRQKGRDRQESPAFSLEEVDDMSEEERWEVEAIWETLSVAENRAELDAEIHTLEALLQQARQIIQRGDEVKLRHFRQALNRLQQEHPGEKILIFTESRDTLDYLERRMREWGYATCTIHGGMPLEARIEAEHRFKNEAQVMIATEAAGEGINLQFCHLMVNYDIPWNPNRLEQRMGRIHRYGQTREVTIFNLVAADTREGRVLQRLFEKLEEIASALGSDKVFDVIDDLFPGRNLAQLLTEAAASARTLDDILREIEIQVDENYLQQVRANLGESLATRYIDYTRIQEMNARAREQRLIPEYTQAFFQKAWARLEGRLRPRKDAGREGYFAIESVPYAIRRIAEEDTFRRRFGPLQRQYPLVTFDKELSRRESRAEFVSFGHPLFEAVLQWAEQELAAALHQGGTFVDPDGRLDGVILFYEGQISDGAGQAAGKRLFALYAPAADGSIRAVNPVIIWDLAPADSPLPGSADLKTLQQQALRALIPQLETYRQELTAERQRQAAIRRKYGVESLRYLVLELDNDLIRLYERQNQGEDVELVIRNKQQQKEEYRRALDELEERLERESHLSLDTPRFLSALRVTPLLETAADTSGGVMHSSPEIEAVGMQLTMDYERAHGRLPEDVSAQDLGYDVRSTDPRSGALRYIEVKARAGVGQVALTQNEWFKAQRFGEDYYLYVALNASAPQPDLYLIRNPAARLQPQEHHEVRYLIPAETIQQAAVQED